MYKITPLQTKEDEKGLPDRGIEVSFTRSDDEEFVNRIWLCKDLNITKTMITDDALAAICDVLNEILQTPIPPLPRPSIIILDQARKHNNENL